MDMNRIKELKLADPFQPFVIVLHDGRRLLVDEPHHVGVAPDGSRLGVIHGETPIFLWPDSVKDVDVVSATGTHR